jgi:hypothetical protein
MHQQKLSRHFFPSKVKAIYMCCCVEVPTLKPDLFPVMYGDHVIVVRRTFFAVTEVKDYNR